MLSLIYVSAITIWVYMTAWFFVAVIAKRNDLADVAWGLGFVVTSSVAMIYSGNKSASSWVVMILVLVWGLRLSWHILRRNIKKPEDYRYQAWRKSWGKWFYPRSYLQVFILQGILMLLILTPVLVIFSGSTRGISGLLILGTFVWLFGFSFEAVGDSQLKKFISNPLNKGKLMTTGLWKYSRHPNYFGEVTQWWGIGVIALAATNGWIGLLGPVTITFLIVKVSGVPLLENKYKDRADYQAYKQKTSMLIPLPPRK